jgi:hypothetical protein
VIRIQIVFGVLGWRSMRPASRPGRLNTPPSAAGVSPSMRERTNRIADFGLWILDLKIRNQKSEI